MEATGTHSRVRTWLNSAGVARTIQVVAVISLILSLFVTVQQRQLTQCLANYNNAYATSAQARTDSAASTASAVDQFISALIAATKLPQDQQQAAGEKLLTTYEAERATANKQRLANPLPEPPKDRC